MAKVSGSDMESTIDARVYRLLASIEIPAY
jgi:hypothetical protein